MHTDVINEFYFYAQRINENEIIIGQEELYHMHKVLRIKENTRIYLTDGEGSLAIARISKIDKKGVKFRDISLQERVKPSCYLHIGIAPTKNISRFEWFLEKATEIGVSEITPILTAKSERKHLRTERLEKILISATKQSKKTWKPRLNEIMSYVDFLHSTKNQGKYIAYIKNNSNHLKNMIEENRNHAVLIGPEGGFSLNEHQVAIDQGYKSVSLGNNRLRTETAGIVVAQIIAMHYD